jgi:nicotinate-nucleotide adenylyltransferase
MPQRVGIMGGTFDPIHLGHLRVAEETAEALELDTLLFVPVAVPPHKPGEKILPFEHRLQMLKIAVEHHPRFRVSDVEQRLPGKSYTVVTLRKLSEAYHGEAELFFVIGMDAFLELDTWWRFNELFELAHMVVLRRPGYNEPEMTEFLMERVSSLYTYETREACFTHPHLLPVHYLNNTWLDISSTRIRQLVKEGKSIRYLVLPKVIHYILTQQLYSAENRLETRIIQVRENLGFRAE